MGNQIGLVLDAPLVDTMNSGFSLGSLAALAAVSLAASRAAACTGPYRGVSLFLQRRVPLLLLLLFSLRFPPWLDFCQDRARVLDVAVSPEPDSHAANFLQRRRLNRFLCHVPLESQDMDA